MNFAYDEDAGLMQSLGLRTTDFGREWTDLGTVSRKNATIKVEVAATPANFWRFTVTTKESTSDIVRDRIITTPLPDKVYLLSTGTGMFIDYWPTVEMVAGHMLVIDMVAQ
jgi:hypothetical protein